MKAIAAALLFLLAGAAPAKVAVGQWSYGLAASGGSVWVGGLERGGIYRVDPGTGRVTAHVPAGSKIFNLASAPGAVWAVSQLEDTVTRIDTRTAKPTLTLHVGYGPYDVAWGFGSAWVSNAGQGSVWRITGRKVVAKIKTGYEPNGLTAYHGALWVTDHTAGELLRIDPATNRITRKVALAGADWITGYGDALYVSQETDVVSRVDLRTLKVTGRVKVARNPLGSAIVGGKLWVPCIDANTIVVVDPTSMKVVERKPGGPSPIVVLPAYGHTWVSHTFADYVSRY